MDNGFDVLFRKSPIAMLICNRNELRFLEVNEKAIALYGYTREQLLTMTAFDIRIEEEHSFLRNFRIQGIGSLNNEPAIRRDRRSNGEIVHVQVDVHEFNFYGTDAYLVAVTDVTGLLRLQEDVYNERLNKERQINIAAAMHQKALESNERRFKALINNSSEAIGIIDTVGNYYFVSENTERLFGYKPEELVGKNAFEFIHEEDAQKTYQELSFIQPGEIKVIQLRFLNRYREWRWVECTVSNYSNDAAISGIVVNSRDITDKKANEDRIKRLSKIAEETVNSVIITDKEGKITWVNSAFSRITGYDCLEVIGHKPSALLQGPHTNPATINYMRQKIQEQEPFEADLVNYRKDRSPYWVHIQCQPQYDENNDLNGFFAIQTDITERKRLEEDLNREIGYRQKKITKAIVSAQEKEREEIGRELHDNVNQMLSTLKLYLDLMRDDSFDLEELVSKCTQLVQDAINEIRRLSSRLAIQNRELDIQEAVQDLIQSISIASKVSFNFKHYNVHSCQLHEDVQLAVYRIVQEHITNILKHAQASRVEISLACIANHLHLKIQDDGKGFDVSKKRNGIGITNMKNRASVADGKLEISSQPGHGCMLTASFPLNTVLRQ